MIGALITVAVLYLLMQIFEARNPSFELVNILAVTVVHLIVSVGLALATYPLVVFLGPAGGFIAMALSFAALWVLIWRLLGVKPFRSAWFALVIMGGQVGFLHAFAGD